MTYNRTAIMAQAWAEYRSTWPASVYRFCRYEFATYLRRAWVEARAVARLLTVPAEAREARAVAIRAELAGLADKSFRVNIAQRGAELRRELARLEAVKARDFSEMTSLIHSAGGRFCAVRFVKKDGTLRTMRIQPATLARHVAGPSASERAQKAFATRKERHPNLLPVWDAAKAACRSVNLATVQSITVNGRTSFYA
ncbi:hypothetical protein FDP22_03930 [Paroceanicella profunda]|uniref:Uncharacterized protein n=1 Tax=Paroceanicella profunda TaxID=2579971 RepID=A0A5B8FWX8_9RHOB|nr:hypothetical protein [Paroceanicella profunda]QDL91009.1 hypothetical protein FDP22_03930 [Paroceanicella profunda]